MIFTWCVTCLFMIQTLQGKGCLFHMFKDALAPNQSLWIQVSESFAQGRTFIRHSNDLKAARQTGSHKKETQKEGLQHWPLTPEHTGETEGSGHCVPAWQLWGQRLPNSSRPWVPQSSAQASGAAERELDPLKLSIISQDWQNSHGLKFGCEVSDEGCRLQTTLRSPCCWCYHKNKQKCRFLFQLQRADGLTNWFVSKWLLSQLFHSTSHIFPPGIYIKLAAFLLLMDAHF